MPMKGLTNFFKSPKYDEISVFGDIFVRNNYKKCRIIYENKIYRLVEIIKSDKKYLKIKLKILTYLTSLAMMFYNCYCLISIDTFSKLNIKYIKEI